MGFVDEPDPAAGGWRVVVQMGSIPAVEILNPLPLAVHVMPISSDKQVKGPRMALRN